MYSDFVFLPESVLVLCKFLRIFSIFFLDCLLCWCIAAHVFIFLNSSGLFPLLANAAMSVKPTLLSLYEIYYLPLGKTLKPGLQGLLTGILPGLEEGSEYYER